VSLITLVRCKRTDPEYQAIRDRHYVPNNGTHGQQIHYKIHIDFLGVVGIISGASSVFAVKPRDDYFGLTKDNKPKGLPSIINNTVFRLEMHVQNLATMVLSMWRKQVAIDWEERYKVKVHGFETFVVENDTRKGALYKADNWECVGNTAGSTKAHPNGLSGAAVRVQTTPKLIFVKKIKKTQLSTEYTPTWRGKAVV
jgi:Domain of unknown function (DUF4338)